jgi:hypothetical protein
MNLKKYELHLHLIKAAAGVAGGALILTEKHPFISLGFLILGAVANEALMYLQRNK